MDKKRKALTTDPEVQGSPMKEPKVSHFLASCVFGRHGLRAILRAPLKWPSERSSRRVTKSDRNTSSSLSSLFYWFVRRLAVPIKIYRARKDISQCLITQGCSCLLAFQNS